MDLYRIISLESFLDLTLNKRERYVNPVTWDDTHEGYLLAYMQSKSGLKYVVQELYWSVHEKNWRLALDSINKLIYNYNAVYGQCWSILPDSDALWRIYSYGNHAIQIASTDELINNVICGEERINYRQQIKKIQYDVVQKEDLLHKQCVQIKGASSLVEPYFHKRKAYEHEKEVRVIFSNPQNHGALIMGEIYRSINKNQDFTHLTEDSEIIDKLCEYANQLLCLYQENAIPKDHHIKIARLQDYIRGVTVHPFAEEWYESLIEEICLRHGLKFNGKSQLYQPIDSDADKNNEK